MNSPFKSSGRSITRKKTGATFSQSGIPIEFAEFNFGYENPVYGLKFGYLGFYLKETIALTELKYGHVIQQPVCIGVILEKGKLKKILEKSLAHPNDNFKLEEIVEDIYELMSEFLLDQFAGIFDLRKAGVSPRVYVVDTPLFNREIVDGRNSFVLGPEAIPMLHAELVFRHDLKLR